MILARTQYIPTYIGDLRAVTGYYVGWIDNEQADAAEDKYEILKNDAEVAHAMHYMSLQAAGDYIEIKTENLRLKSVLKWMISKINDFVHVRKSLAYSSILYGLGIQKKTYKEIKKFGLTWQVPYKLKEVDRRRLRIEYNPEDKTEQYWTLWSPKKDAYIILEDRNKVPNAEIAVQDFVWMMHEIEETSPYFRGFGEVLCPLVYIKQKLLLYWSELCEGWARPFLVAIADTKIGTINSTAGNTLQQRVDAILDSFEIARSRHAVVIDKNDKFEYHEKGTSGSNILKEYISYLDNKILMLIVGSELATSMPKKVGSYALGRVHQSVTGTIISYNRTRMAETLKIDLFQDFINKNRENFYLLDIDCSLDNVSFSIVNSLEEMKRDALETAMEEGNVSRYMITEGSL